MIFVVRYQLKLL